MISAPLSIAVVAADIALAGVLIAGIAHAARAASSKLTLWVGAGAIAAWFATAIVVAKQGIFEQTQTTTFPPPIGAGIAIPIVLGCVLLTLPAVKRAIDQISLQWLVGVQLYRVFGALFLIAYLQGDMPAEFALPAGIGDVLVAIAAPFVAISIARNGIQTARTRVVAWCALGILDLAVALTCGFFTAPSAFQQLALDSPNAAIMSYPFVLIPTFAVPVALILHVCVLARVLKQRRTAGQPVLAGRVLR